MPAPVKGLPEVVPKLLLVLLLEDEETLLDELDVLPPVPVLELEEAAEELLDELGGTTLGPELEAEDAALLEDLLDEDELVGALDEADDDTLEADEEDLLEDEELLGTLEDAADDDTLEADEDDLLEDEELLGVLDEAADDETLDADEEDLLEDEELLGTLDEAADELEELEALRSAQKPTEVLVLFAGIVLFHDIGVIETLVPLCAQVAFQSWFTLPLGRVMLPFQSLTAVVPELVTVTWPQKPVPQSLLIA